MSVELENGNVVFKYDLGAGAAKISHPHYVSDNKWYKVTAKRSVPLHIYSKYSDRLAGTNCRSRLDSAEGGVHTACHLRYIYTL